MSPGFLIALEPSAGYWQGEADIEDLAFWIHHSAPVLRGDPANQEALRSVHRILRQLTFRRLDETLYMTSEGVGDGEVSSRTGLDVEIVARIRVLAEQASLSKGRSLHMRLAAGEGCQ